MNRTIKRLSGPGGALLSATANIAVVLTLLVLATPTTVMSIILLAPTLMVYAVDTSPGKTQTRAVVLFGMAASCSAFDVLWHAGQSVETAFAIAMEFRRLSVGWAAQAGAWLLAQILPVLVELTLETDAARKIAALERRKEELTVEWT
jgi:anaerobic C4-dicarboxylate transporter